VSTKRLWLIAGGAAALVAIIVLVLTSVFPKASEAEPTPTPTVSTTPTSAPPPTPSATPTPTPTESAPTTVVATCENTSTAEFRAKMAGNDWVSWETQDEQIGARPFDVFPNGTPDGAIVCRWGADPNLATDNVIDLAWSPIDPENAVAAMDKLETEGYTRLTMADGIYLAMEGPPGYTDAEGWGLTYYFGIDDVRWAATKADVTNDVKAPTEAD
jgi:hypothetical protein